MLGHCPLCSPGPWPDQVPAQGSSRRELPVESFFNVNLMSNLGNVWFVKREVIVSPAPR